MHTRRNAIARTQAMILVVVVVVVVAAVAAFALLGSGSGTSQSSSGTLSLAIVETDPVNQVDSLSPANLTVAHGTTVTLAVQNHDDAPRFLQISAFNINATIDSGTTQRVTFTVGSPGVFQMYVPARPAENALKASPAITGYLIVS